MVKKARIFQDRRAITPVLSNLLLTVVAVAAMAMATTATYVITNNLKENMSERLIVEDVWFSISTETVSVYVRNVGEVAVQVSAVYLNHTSEYFTKPFNLEVGEHSWLVITVSLIPDSLYYIDVLTSRGNHIADYYATS